MSVKNRQKRHRNKLSKSVYLEDRTVALMASAIEAAKGGDDYSKEMLTLAAMGNEARARWRNTEGLGVHMGKLQADLEWLTAGLVSGAIKPNLPMGEQVTEEGEVKEPPSLHGSLIKAMAERWDLPISVVMEEVNAIVEAGGSLTEQTLEARVVIRASVERARERDVAVEPEPA